MGDVVIRNATTLKLINRFSLGSGPILCVLVSSDLRFLLVGGADGELTILTDPEATFGMIERSKP